MDSYFASIEQYLRPALRGRPLGVAPMMVETTCCIAASYEAKAFGVKTGTMVAEARKMCPGIEIVEARPPVYVEMHHEIVDLVESCLHVDHVLSIDEMLCGLPTNLRTIEAVEGLAVSIKEALAGRFGDSVRCSIGVAPNGWLAKVGSKMKKPNGFQLIKAADLPEVLFPLSLRDLHGVGRQMELRLHAKGIHEVAQLCRAPKALLRSIWNGVEGERMWHKLRGDAMEDVRAEAQKKSISHGHVLPPELRRPELAVRVAHRLVQKAASRMRHHGLYAGGMDLQLRFEEGGSWVASANFPETMDSLVFSRLTGSMWSQRPDAEQPVKKINVVLHHLCAATQFTPSLFDVDQGKHDALNTALDRIAGRFGKQALYLGGAHGALESAAPKIAFNHIPDLKVER